MDDSQKSVTAGARGEFTMTSDQRPAPHRTHLSSNEPPPAPPPSAPRQPRRVAFACAAAVAGLLAALLAAAPAAAQTDVWTATLTPADFGSGFIGCANDRSTPSELCSTATVLSDDDFTHDSTDYSVISLFLSSGTLSLKLDTDITTATAALTLVVGTTSLALADATTITNTVRVWSSTGLSWTAGTAVSVRLAEPVTNNPPTVANAIPDQSATAGTAFSYVFPANTFSDADTGDTLSYTATKTDDTALPTWLAFTASTRTFSGTPQAADIATVAVKVTASDGNGGSVSDTFDITVAADTTPPTLTSARVNEAGLFILLGFSENLQLSNLPPASAFTVTAGGSAVTVGGVLPRPGAPDVFVITVSPAIRQGQAIVVTYTDPTAGDDATAFQDVAGNDAATFTTGMDGVPAVTNNSTFTNTPATGAPTITGTAQVGQTLTAGTTAIMDADGLTSVSYTYQWIRVATDNSETDIGATASTYTLVAADLGTTIKVRVSFTDDASNAETLTSAATAAVSAVVPADWSLKPTAVAAGDKFRLLFLSSTKRNSTATGIATYNTFIQTRAAAGHTDIRAYSAGFRVVGCTAAVDARDNTATTYTTSDKGVPIYWLNGAKAADQYEDFYDGSWDDEANDKNESGTNGPDTSQNNNLPVTGCSHDGTELTTFGSSRALGAAQVSVGRPNSSGSGRGPLFADALIESGFSRPLYGLSAVFQVAAAVVVPNNPPAFSADTAARSVAENTAAGQNVGAALTATDADSDTLTYTLEGTDAASFDIVSGSGQIRTRTGVTYNHEAKSTHTVVVKADDGNGGTDTVTVTITVTDVDEPPGQPAAPSVSATAGSTTSLDVTWTAPTNTGPAIASYDLQYRAGTSGNFTNGPQNVTGTSAAIGSLAADTSYEVQVRATNAEGDGDWSVAGTGRTTATSAPGAPTGLTATASGTTQIDLSWSAPASTGGSAITGYKIEVSPNGTSSWTNLVANTNSTATTYVHTGLASGDTRHYRVSAINANGAGTASNVDSATTVQVPAAVSNVVAVPVPRTTDSLQVSWSAPDNAGKPALTGYDVRYREDVNWTTVSEDATSTSLIIGGLRDAFYDVQVRALNADGSGPWSSTAEAVTSPRAERVYANHPLIPADLGPGDSFRLLFITRATTAATDTGIHTYHNFASTDAIHIVEAGNLVSEWGTISLLQTPLVSTPGADARLHTDTTWTETDRGMPIYWLNGARVADDYADFYDGVWADEANPTNGLGNPHSLAGTAPWTGTDHDGTELFNGTASRAIGQASVSVGGLGSTITGAGPLNGGVIFANTQERPIYGLWHVLVVDENLRLVTNFQQLSRDASGIDARAAVRAQLFTTGPNSTGYGISSIEVVTGADTNIFLGTVALYTTDTDGNPDLADGLHATLSLERVINNYLWRLVAPEGTVLKPTTTYAMVFLGDAGTYPEPWTIDSDGEDVPADGWSLADALLYWSGTSWVENPNGRSLSMEIVGPRLETEGPALVSATVGAAGTAVTLVFDEDVVLPSDSAEALTFLASLASAFAVTADGAGVAVSGLTAASGDSDQLTIVLSGVILQGQAVTLTYTDPTAGDDAVALQDVLGNETPTFSTGLHGVPAVINNSTITVLTTTVPGAPTGLTATASGTTAINLSWSAPGSTGGSAITGYKIEVSPNGTSGWTDQVADTSNTTTTYTHTGLGGGDTRHYRVSAINANGAGTASNVDSATTGTTVPGAPTGLTATASGTTAINLSWSAPGSTGGSAITGYKIEVSPNGTSGWTDQVADTSNTTTTYTHTGLGGGDTRHYRVSAINANGAGTASNVDSATTGTTVPGAPTGLTATASGTTAINLSWSAPGSTGGSAITGYKIEVSPNGTSGWTDQVADTSNTTTTYTHTGLGGGDTRHYRVSAINANGAGTASNVDSATTGTTAPGAPTGLTAIASGTTAINLSWSAPGSTGGSAITGYKIEVSSDGGSSWSDLVANTSNTTTTYTHTGLGGGDTRHYRVSAINANGAGTASNVDSATTGTTVPGAPTGLTATASGTTAINLSWSAPGSTGGSAITGYKIEVSPNGTSGWTDQVADTSNTTTTYTHTGLGGGDTRHYRVSAINANGAGTASNVDSATTGTTAPGAPTGLTATASGTTAINLSWSAPASTGGSAITGYKIEVSSDGGSSWSDLVANTSNTTTTYAHTGLAAGDTRHYRVSAINTNGAGTASNVANATTDATAPGAPTGLTATASGTTAINLSWSAPASTGGSAITGYKIEVSADGTSGWTDQVANTSNTATTYAHTGLGGGTTRHYRVSAINANGAGTASNVDSATTGTTVPGAPTGLTATASGTTAINLSWSAPGSTGGSAITGYKIEVSANGTSGWTDQVANTNSTATTTYTHTGLGGGTTRHYRVSAINANGAGTASNVDSATTGTTVPGAPTGLTATASGTTAINLSWSAPGSTGGSAITGYKIEVSPNGTSGWTDQVANTGNANTTYAHTGLTAGATRHYRVSAINANGAGVPSNVDSATTGATAPGAPTGLTATASGTTAINLSWSAPGSTGGSAITGYKIEVSSNGGSSWTNLVANTSNTTTSYAHTGLTAGATRHYRVSAINANGAGTASNVANATTGQTTVTFGASSYTAAEGGATATVAVQLSAAASATVTIPLTKTHRGGATAADYSGVPSNVTFTAGQTRRTFTVTATDDADKDGGESVRIGFGTLPGGYAPGARRTATVTLVDDDANLIVNFGTERHTTVKVRESDTVWHRFIFSLSTSRYGPPNGNPQQPVTIPLVVTRRGGATAADYKGIPEDVTFAVGQSVTDFFMMAIPDGKREPGEGLRLDFGPLPPGVRKGTWGPHETIEFVDQVLPGYTVLFGAEAYTATEGGADARVSIHLNEPVEIESVEVRLLLKRVGATAADYTGIPKSVRFAVGEQTQTITVKATDDTDDDDGESVTLSFVNDPNGRVRVRTGSASATVALADNDGLRRVTVSFGAVTYTATEGGADATVRVELDAAPGRSVTVPLTKAHLGNATAADYSGIPMNVTFAANQTLRTFAVMATADQIADGGESVSIGFGTLPEGVFAGSPAATTVTLADGGEQRLVVNFGSSRGHTVQVREGARRLRLNVLLDSSPRRPVTIPLVVTHVGGATEADYAAIPESVTFAAGQTSAHYYVRALPDEEEETGEGLRLDFGPLPPGVRKGTWGPYETIAFVDAGQTANLSVAGLVLTLDYPWALDGGSTPSPRDFVVSAEVPGGAKDMVPVAAVSLQGSDVFLQLDRPVAPDETVTLTYLTAAMHPIRAAAGRPAAPLTDEPVLNVTGASGPLAEAGLAAGTALPAPIATMLEAAQEGAGTERLDLSSRNLTELSALAGLSGLRELDLRHNAITDLSPLAGLTGLEVLNLSGNQIEELWPLAGLTALQRLDLSGNRIEDIATLAELTGLEVLNLSGNRIEELWPLAGLTALQRLDLSDNRIEELWPLAGLSGLQVLLLDRNRVADVSALSPLAELANLGLSGNQIADIGLLTELGRLHRLDLSGNAVADVSALGDVSGLVWLQLPGNPVSDVTPLGRLEKLLWLWLDSRTAAGMEALAPPAGRGEAQLWIELTPAQ